MFLVMALMRGRDFDVANIPGALVNLPPEIEGVLPVFKTREAAEEAYPGLPVRELTRVDGLATPSTAANATRRKR